MSARLVNWWLLRTTRERVLISLLGAVLCALVIWMVVWRPVERYLGAARTEQTAALDRLQRVRTMVAEIKAPHAPPSVESVDAIAVQAATEAGFALTRNVPQEKDQISVSVSTVKSPALFVWLRVLEQRGVIVMSANVATNGDGTVAFEGVLRKRGI